MIHFDTATALCQKLGSNTFNACSLFIGDVYRHCFYPKNNNVCQVLKKGHSKVLECVMIVSSISAFADKEEILRRFTNFSQTTVSKETVPTQPPPTADSPHNPSTTAATKVKDTETTPFILPNGDSSDEEVEYCFFL